jgi:quercetin dioxygenase-like cupin family protein
LKEAIFSHSFNHAGSTINVYHADKGSGIGRHEHDYSHITVCITGSCWVRKENKEILMDKNTQPINLLPDGWHEIESAEDGTVFINIFDKID